MSIESFLMNEKAVSNLIMESIDSGDIEITPREETRFREFGECFFVLTRIDITGGCASYRSQDEIKYPHMNLKISIHKSKTGRAYYKITITRDINEYEADKISVFDIWGKEKRGNKIEQFISKILLKYNIILSATSIESIRRNIDTIGIGTGCNR